ncbi:hypothetical protein [Mycolicibacterium celeriflavum]|uniref:hypothetical protein n=1 Tax=Mycolicibacterium celeriflavum TaxID=1249101 RepID=UPI001F3C4081|nr:hypothetical protein [Mycolicibacterium celeriflavum]
MVRYIESHGSLPTAMWDSVASLGPVLAATVEQLRNHASRVLGSLDAGESVSERAKLLQQAVKDKKLPETLNLLVAAEDSLYKWQRLLVARVGATEHHHLQRVIDDSRALLARQLELDGELYQNAKSAIEAVSRTNDIDGFRWLSVQKLNRDRDTLRSALDEFAGARRHQVESWQELTTPGVRVATSASVKIARKTTGRALSSAGERLTRLGDNLVDRESPERKRAAPPQRNPSDD